MYVRTPKIIPMALPRAIGIFLLIILNVLKDLKVLEVFKVIRQISCLILRYIVSFAGDSA